MKRGTSFLNIGSCKLTNCNLSPWVFLYMFIIHNNVPLGEMCYNIPLIYCFFLHTVNARTLVFSRKLWHIRVHRVFYLPERRSGEKEKREYKYNSFKSMLNPYIFSWLSSQWINTKQLVIRKLNFRMLNRWRK